MQCDFLVLTGMIKPKQSYGYGKKNGSMAIAMPIGVSGSFLSKAHITIVFFAQ